MIYQLLHSQLSQKQVAPQGIVYLPEMGEEPRAGVQQLPLLLKGPLFYLPRSQTQSPVRGIEMQMTQLYTLINLFIPKGRLGEMKEPQFKLA